MTAFAVIVACIAFVLVAGMSRGKPGRGIADTALLVFLLGVIALADLLLRQAFDTGDIASTLAMALAAIFALDALYGLMAPERQRTRDRRLRRLMKRRT